MFDLAENPRSGKTQAIRCFVGWVMVLRRRQIARWIFCQPAYLGPSPSRGALCRSRFAAMDRERPDGGFMVVDALTGLNRKRVIEFAGSHRIPFMYEGDLSFGTAV